MTTECSSAILEAAEIERQRIGLKTVGRGPSVVDRAGQQQENLIQDQQASADAIHYIAANAESLLAQCDAAESFESAQLDFRINTRDRNPPNQERDSATKKQLKFFEKTVEGVSMDILD